VAVALHERTPGDTGYANWAQREWAWFQGSGMLTGSHLVIDGLAACKPDLSSPTWTYNQGVLIGALVALARMTGGEAPLATARRIAGAVMDSQALSPHGILRDPCEPSSCDEDQPLFKGIFMRNLKVLADQVDQAGGVSYREYLRHNAVAVWSNDRRGDEFGLSWSGPFDSASTARQTSALDILNTQVSAHPGG
jgi:predicted alpha-1,6-mannanase (GH76 family)